jgi:AmiR/NasT family two-component response regulator
MLRSEARSKRKKIAEIANTVVTASEIVNQFPYDK